MDIKLQQLLARIIRSARVAALGTVYDGEPRLSMVTYSVARDFSAFYIHLSKLGAHTMDMQKKNAVSMLIVDIDDGLKDPQSLARVSLRCIAEVFPNDAPGYTVAKSLYTKRFSGSENLFSSDNFNLWRIIPKGGRYVAGMTNAFNIVPSMLKTVSSLLDE